MGAWSCLEDGRLSPTHFLFSHSYPGTAALTSCMKKKIWIALAVLFVFLFITNPSLSDFKDNGHYGANYRTSNWLIFSFFVNYQQGQKSSYLGICKNFIPIDQ
jgi:hypothetical protein